jgi:hypothetical protein
VKNRFQNLPFKCNLQRYTKCGVIKIDPDANAPRIKLYKDHITVGLCRLNQVDS